MEVYARASPARHRRYSRLARPHSPHRTSACPPRRAHPRPRLRALAPPSLLHNSTLRFCAATSALTHHNTHNPPHAGQRRTPLAPSATATANAGLKPTPSANACAVERPRQENVPNIVWQYAVPVREQLLDLDRHEFPALHAHMQVAMIAACVARRVDTVQAIVVPAPGRQLRQQALAILFALTECRSLARHRA